MTSVSPCVANRWPARSQALAQLAVVVDLAVEDDRDRAVLVEDRLVAGGEVDDAQALDPEADARRRRGVRASPGRGARAPRTCAAERRVGAPAVTAGLSDDPAHGPRGRSLGKALWHAARRARRIAFIDYFATHYRLRLYEELARRMEMDFYFFADERERYWNRKIPLVRDGDFRRIELRRYRVGGQAFMPGVALTLHPRRYDAVVKSLNGKVMLPLVYVASRPRGLPFVLWTGMWYHPRTRFHRVTRPLTGTSTAAPTRSSPTASTSRASCSSVDVEPSKVFVAGQAVEADRFTAVQPGAQRRAEVLFIGQFEARKGVSDLLDAFAAARRPRAAPARGQRLAGAAVTRSAARDPRVEIVGYLPQEDLPAVLARSRALVLPSVTTELDQEPWGLVVNEAMHAGLPVVTTDAVGAAAGGLVRDGGNGLVVPERDRRRSARRCAGSPRTPALAARSATRPGATWSASPTAPWRTPSRRPSSTRSPLATHRSYHRLTQYRFHRCLLQSPRPRRCAANSRSTTS